MFPRFFGRLDISAGAMVRLACLCLGMMYLAACAETQFVAATVKGKAFQIRTFILFP